MARGSFGRTNRLSRCGDRLRGLIPQEGINYGIVYGNLNVLARRDGIVIWSTESAGG